MKNYNFPSIIRRRKWFSGKYSPFLWLFTAVRIIEMDEFFLGILTLQNIWSFQKVLHGYKSGIRLGKSNVTYFGDFLLL